MPILFNDPKFQEAFRNLKMPALVHICCCNPNIALCGAQVTGQVVDLVHPKHSRRPCLVCVSIDQRRQRCADPKCPGPDPEGI